jgi:uncharacterized protein
MPIIWGGDEPEFADISEAQTVLGTIIARYNQIISNLRDDPGAFEPIFWQRGGRPNSDRSISGKSA